eukprot:CAMPEP_0117739134 /NCGR_PEP_ID=MMETSP0947-20121206/3559_1 /TAXON_ID=44440 /ORGANISM="Chattonella subsalsa, Strain CCMP2191" /LENGTH=301 /DNA_ID=CAMNT_0005554987 /DNA_START=308 /DNA_END=1213 /DNA_ORIENTATION=+
MGECKYGDTCMFQHEPLPGLGGCKYFSQGECKFGDSCLFPHVVQDPVAANAAIITATVLQQAAMAGLDQNEVIQELVNQGVIPSAAAATQTPATAGDQLAQHAMRNRQSQSIVPPALKEDPNLRADSRLLAASKAYIEQENFLSLKKMVEEAAASDECPYIRSSLSRSPSPDPEETKSAIADAVKERLKKGEPSEGIGKRVIKEQKSAIAAAVAERFQKSKKRSRSRSRSKSHSRRQPSSHKESSSRKGSSSHKKSSSTKGSSSRKRSRSRKRSSSKKRSSDHHRSDKSRKRSSSRSRKKR